MTATDIAERSGGSRKIRWLAIGIVLFLIVYSGAWFLAASQIETRLSAFLDGKKATGSSAECADMDVRGFPFRIGLFCDKVRLDDTAKGASATFGALRSAAQVYRPGHAIIELDGPAEIRISPGLSVSADWELMHASMQATLSGLDRTSITYDQLAGTAVVPSMDDDAPDGATHKLAFAAGHGELHLRQNGADLDAAVSIDKLDTKLDGGPSLLPALNASADLTFVDRAALMEAGGLVPNALHNSKGEMRNLTLDFGGGMVTTASGPFSVDDRGLISGEFHVTMKNIEGWRQNLVKAFPDKDDTVMINNIANMLTALADGKNEATVKLNVRDGIAFLAFFPIGELPQL
ncbi:hypothetical protein ADU59_12905 [Pararhizobium polonicum]|uniref:DUF2125 domain-containing protein n=1 Tax=Pararhizobium polonicum TaxID=1612624 RepID=A0A1C7P2E5_9HYPH|nr:DUF2125 domain-containing protein [Pararhizobium polonicum]OBZ95452.1 hypothetical protein ADU59_12905 [Pararhizobium polonicum]